MTLAKGRLEEKDHQSSMEKPLRRLSRWLRRPLHERDARRRLAAFHSREHSLEEIVRTSLDLGSKGLLKIKAQQRFREISQLAQAVRDLKPRTVLEIGTARGGTLLIWAQLASRKVITCDLEQPGYRRRTYARFPPPGSSCAIVPLAGNSHDPAFRVRVERELGGDPVDFLLIDGDHTLTGVTADYEDYRSLVRPGGIIAFHDIIENQPFASTQVHRLWARLRELLEVEEIVDDPDQCGFGIGIVRV